MLSIFDIVAGLLTLTAVFAWLNHRFLGLPNNAGLLLMGLAASLVLVALEVLVPQVAVFGELESFIEKINFSETLLDGMLAFLLFAGALQINLLTLRDRAWAVGAMATLGVVIPLSPWRRCSGAPGRFSPCPSPSPGLWYSAR